VFLNHFFDKPALTRMASPAGITDGYTGSAEKTNSGGPENYFAGAGVTIKSL
jgi:hypothetical protein